MLRWRFVVAASRARSGIGGQVGVCLVGLLVVEWLLWLVGRCEFVFGG